MPILHPNLLLLVSLEGISSHGGSIAVVEVVLRCGGVTVALHVLPTRKPLAVIAKLVEVSLIISLGAHRGAIRDKVGSIKGDKLHRFRTRIRDRVTVAISSRGLSEPARKGIHFVQQSIVLQYIGRCWFRGEFGRQRLNRIQQAVVLQYLSSCRFRRTLLREAGLGTEGTAPLSVVCRQSSVQVAIFDTLRLLSPHGAIKVGVALVKLLALTVTTRSLVDCTCEIDSTLCDHLRHQGNVATVTNAHTAEDIQHRCNGLLHMHINIVNPHRLHNAIRNAIQHT